MIGIFWCLWLSERVSIILLSLLQFIVIEFIVFKLLHF
jgi:hypothetical protein